MIRRDLHLKKFNIKYALGCSILGLIIPNIVTFNVARYIDSGILTAIANLTPLIVYPLTVILKMERLRWGRLLFIIWGMIGVFSLIHIKINFDYITDFNLLKYFLLALTVPFFYASSMIFVARFKPMDGNILNYSFSMLLIASCIICPYVLSNNNYYPLKFDDFKSFLIIIEVLLSTIGYLLMFLIINRVGAVLFALVSPLTMVFGLFYGSIIFKQKLELSSYISILIILTAILLLIYTNKRD
jgi:drug/metabolite transporter (DMT)-like permease